MRTARSLTSILVIGAATSTLTACPGNQEEPAVSFARASAAQRAAVVPATLDLTGERAANLVTLAELDHGADATCPTRSLDGDTVVYQADGCQGAASGVTWKGRIEAESSPRTDLLGAAGDPGKPEELRFIDLHADRVDAPLAVDGVLRRTRGALAGHTRIRNELTVDAGESIRLAIDADCELDGSYVVCRTLDGAEGELVGVGRFDIVATTRSTLDQVSGTVVLRGEDELSLDTDDRDANECLTYDVAGVPGGSVCLTELSSGDATTADGVSWACEDGGTLRVTGFARGAPIYTKVQLRRAGVQKQLALALVSHDAGTDEYQWASPSVPLADAGSFTCAQLATEVGVRLVAVYADGTTDCHLTGDWNEFDGLACF